MRHCVCLIDYSFMAQEAYFSLMYPVCLKPRNTGMQSNKSAPDVENTDQTLITWSFTAPMINRDIYKCLFCTKLYCPSVSVDGNSLMSAALVNNTVSWDSSDKQFGCSQWRRKCATTWSHQDQSQSQSEGNTRLRGLIPREHTTWYNKCIASL